MSGNHSSKIKKLATIRMLVALISVISQLSIPMPGMVPLTLQIFAIAFVGYFLGCKYATVTVCTYILIGAIGVPVFASFKGGIAALFGYTGGFIWGFLIVAIMCGIFADRAKLAISLGIISVLIAHLIGVSQYMIVARVDFFKGFLLVSCPYILKDIILIPIAFSVAKKLKKHIRL